MKRLLAILLLAGAPAFAANSSDVDILRGTSAPQPATDQAPAPQPTVIEVPIYYPQPVYYFYVPVRRPVAVHHHHHFRR